MAEIRILAVASHKGGVGKTTTAQCLGAGLALDGDRVLLVDMDPQACLSTACGQNVTASGKLSMAEVLNGTCKLADAVVSLRNGNIKDGYLDLVPTALSLSEAEESIQNKARREDRLLFALEEADLSPWDWIIVDCPPSMGLLTRNVFRVASSAVIPVQCEFLALEGVAKTMYWLERWKAERLLQADFKVISVLPTFYDSRKNICRDVLAVLLERYRDLVSTRPIRDNVKLVEAGSNGLDIFAYEPKCHGAEDYALLAREIASRWKARETA